MKQYVLLHFLRIANLCNHKGALSLSPSLSLSIKQTNQPDKHHIHTHIHNVFKMTYKKKRAREKDHLYTYLPFEIEEQRKCFIVFVGLNKWKHTNEYSNILFYDDNAANNSSLIILYSCIIHV